MNSEHLTQFPIAFNEVLREIGFEHITFSVNEEYRIPTELLASIGITGDLKGFLLLRSSMQSMLAFIDKVLQNMGMDSDENGFGPFHREAFGEILNQLSGRAMMKLSDVGYNCDITPPTILLGSNITYNFSAMVGFINQDIQGAFGTINVFAGINEHR